MVVYIEACIYESHAVFWHLRFQCMRFIMSKRVKGLSNFVIIWKELTMLTVPCDECLYHISVQTG